MTCRPSNRARSTSEIDFILETAGRYLHKAPTRADVLSVFVGIRPLVKSGDSTLTSALSRDHTIHIDASGLLTTTGGKWTTYRRMAEDTVTQAAELADLPDRQCVTRALSLHGFHQNARQFGSLSVYGSDAPAIQELMRADPALAAPLHPALPYTGAEVVWAVREEMARTIEDVLARRCRALFLNAGAAVQMVPAVASADGRRTGLGRPPGSRGRPPRSSPWPRHTRSTPPQRTEAPTCGHQRPGQRAR